MRARQAIAVAVMILGVFLGAPLQAAASDANAANTSPAGAGAPTEANIEDIQVALATARAHIAERRFANAEETLRAILKGTPTLQEARVLLAIVYMEDARGERDDDAERMLQQVLDGAPDDTQALFHLGRLNYYKQDYERAAKLFTKVSEQDPRNPAAAYYLGEIAWREYRDDQAEIAYRRALDIDSGYAKPYYSLAFLYYKQKKYADAQSYAKQAIEKVPDDYRSLNLLGIIYYETYKDAESEAHYRLAIEKNPGFAFAYFNLGMLYYSQHSPKTYAKARDAFSKALTYFDKQRDEASVTKVEGYLRKVEVLLKGGKVEDVPDPIKNATTPPARQPRRGEKGSRSP